MIEDHHQHHPSTFVNPAQVFQRSAQDVQHTSSQGPPFVAKPGLQRHLSLNLGGRTAFDQPPSLSPMSLHDSAYSAAAYPSSPVAPHTATSSSNATVTHLSDHHHPQSASGSRTSRHKPRRSLSAGDLSHMFSSAAGMTTRPDAHGVPDLRSQASPPQTQTKPQSSNSSFIGKLWNMLHDDTEYASLISFSANGASFVISNATEFAKTILPNHFKHNNFSSFVRQLNMYGFSKLNKTARGMRGAPESQIWEFSHPKFHRDRPDLLDTIRRKTMEDSTTSTIAVPISPASARLHQTRAASAEAAAVARSEQRSASWSSSAPEVGNAAAAPVHPASGSPLSTPLTPVSNVSGGNAAFQESPDMPSQPSPQIQQQQSQQQQQAQSQPQAGYYESTAAATPLLSSDPADVGRYISTLQQNCRILRDLVEDGRRKQGVLIDVVGQLYNHAQQVSAGQLSFDFPAVLQEEAFASAAIQEMPPIIIDGSRAMSAHQDQHAHQSVSYHPHHHASQAGFTQHGVSSASRWGPTPTPYMNLNALNSHPHQVPTAAAPPPPPHSDGSASMSLPASPIPPPQGPFAEAQNQGMLGLGLPFDSSKYHETSSSDFSSGGDSDFSETMMR